MKNQHMGRKVIESAAQALCEAVRSHANLFSTGSNDPRAVATASARIDQAATAYAQAVREVSGWGVSFEPYREGIYPKYDQLLAEHAEAGGGLASQETMWPVVVDRFEIDIASEPELIGYAHARLGVSAARSEEALRLLCESDGWDISSYPQDLLIVDDHAVDILPNEGSKNE